MTAAVILGIGLALFVAVSSAQTTTEQVTQPYWHKNNCDHGYSVISSKRGVRHSRSYTQARKFWRCSRTVENARRVRAYWVRWKRSYKGYWRIQVLKNPGVHDRLATLRFCESRGNYAIDSHHDGAYQYDTPTWSYGQSVYGAPYSKRTTYAHQASVDHQDAVTGYLFPRETSRWNASRHCWG